MSFRSRFEHLEGRRPERDDPRAAPLQNDRFAGLGEEPAALPEEAEAEAFLEQPGVRADGTVDRTAVVHPDPGGRAARFAGVSGGELSEPMTAEELAAEPPPDRIASSVPAWRGEAMPPDVAAEIRRKLGLPEPGSEPVQPRREELFRWADRRFEQERMESGLLWLVLARRYGHYAVVVLAVAVLLFSLIVRGCAAATGRW